MKAKTFSCDIFKNIMQRLNTDRKRSGKFCDVKVFADGFNFPVHKCILGLISEYYGQVFFGQIKKEKPENQLKKETMERILDFIYTGKLIVTSENIYDLLKAAHFMEIPYIKDCCVTFLEAEVNPENCLLVRSHVWKYNYPSLIEKIDVIIGENLNSIMFKNDFKQMDLDKIKVLFYHLKKKQISSAETSYQALIGWIKHDVATRGQNITNLLSLIDFTKLSWTFLNQVVAIEPLIEASHECTKMLLHAMRNHSGTRPASERLNKEILPAQHSRSKSADIQKTISIAHKRSLSGDNVYENIVPVQPLPRQRIFRSPPAVPSNYSHQTLTDKSPPPLPTKPPRTATDKPPLIPSNKALFKLRNKPPPIPNNKLPSTLPDKPPGSPADKSLSIPSQKPPPISNNKQPLTPFDKTTIISSSKNHPKPANKVSTNDEDATDENRKIIPKPRAVCKPRRSFIKVSDVKPCGFTFFKGDKAWKFDVTSGKLAALPNLKCDHENGCMIQFEQKVYVISGKWTNKVEKLDLSFEAAEWTEISPALHRRCSAAPALWQETICVVGGRSFNPTSAPAHKSASLSLNEAYNPVEDAWFESSEKSDGLYDHAVVTIGDILYTVGGEKSDGFKCFDPSVGEWQLLPPMSTQRGGLSAVVLDNEIYAIGGRDENGEILASVEKYNFKFNSWIDVADLNVARYHHSAGVFDEKIYVVGGNTPAMEMFDAAEMKWRVTGEFEEFYQIDSLAVL